MFTPGPSRMSTPRALQSIASEVAIAAIILRLHVEATTTEAGYWVDLP